MASKEYQLLLIKITNLVLQILAIRNSPDKSIFLYFSLRLRARGHFFAFGTSLSADRRKQIKLISSCLCSNSTFRFKVLHYGKNFSFSSLRNSIRNYFAQGKIFPFVLLLRQDAFGEPPERNRFIRFLLLSFPTRPCSRLRRYLWPLILVYKPLLSV